MLLQYAVISKQADSITRSQIATANDDGYQFSLFRNRVDPTTDVAGTRVSATHTRLTRLNKYTASDIPGDPVMAVNHDGLQVASYGMLISGTVTDASGIPLAGVLVKRDGKTQGARTDSSGFYHLPVEELDKSYPILIFLKSGYRRKMVRMVESDFGTANQVSLNVAMVYSPDTITLNGWVGETNGTSIRGEVIRLYSLSEGLYYSAHSNASGNFSFEGIKRGVNYKVAVKPSEKYKTIKSSYLTMTDYSIPLYITLEPIHLVSLSGVIVDSYGRPVKKLKFKIRSEINSVYDSDLKSDEFGRFELPAFPMGRLSVTTQSPLYFKVSGIDLSQSSFSNLVIPLDLGPHRLSGWVRNQNGQPLQGARVMLDAEFNIDGMHSSSVRTYVTDETGYFEFKSLGPAEHYLTVYAKGFINQGISYDTGTRVDPLYLNLSKWNDQAAHSGSLKIKINQAGADVNRSGSQPSSIFFITETTR